MAGVFRLPAGSGSSCLSVLPGLHFLAALLYSLLTGNHFQMYILFLKCKLKLILTPALFNNLSSYLTLLLSMVQIGTVLSLLYSACYSFVFFSPTISMFSSNCTYARNLSFLAERASNHSSFNMFWLSFCVFPHVGSSCLPLHSGISWQQVILFHIGKTPCECINLYTWFLRIT